MNDPFLFQPRKFSPSKILPYTVNYLLPESLVFTCARILFLVSLLFVALLDPFDPYSPFKFLFFINLVTHVYVTCQ